MHHDNGADETRGCCPACRPGVVTIAFAIQECDVKCLRKILTQIVRGAHLKRFPITHECFHRVGSESPGKFLALVLFSLIDGNRELSVHKSNIEMEN